MLGIPIVIGWGDKAVEVRRGEFLCPDCGTIQPYILLQLHGRIWLYYIIPIPTPGSGKMVTICGGCQSEMDGDIASETRERYEKFIAEAAALRAKEEMIEASFGALIGIATADPDAGDEALEPLRRHLNRVTGRTYSVTGLRREIAPRLGSDRATRLAELARIAPRIDADERDHVVEAARAIAAATSSEEPRALVGRLEEILAVEPAE